MRRDAPLAAALLLSACTPDPEADVAAVRLDSAGVAAWPGASVGSARHAVTVRDTLHAHTACLDFDADVLVHGNDLRLRITSAPTDEACAGGTAVFEYRAVVRDLPSGQYNLRVIHAHAPEGTPRLVREHPIGVLDRRVTVP